MTRARTRYARRPARARSGYNRRRYASSRSPRLNVGLIALIVVAVVLIIALST
jgi:hypothetical protein